MFNLIKDQDERVTTDSGEIVTINQFAISGIYRDSESENLNEKYDVQSTKGFIPSSLGSSNVEGFASELLNFYKTLGGFCGIPKEELREIYHGRVGDLEGHKFLRNRKIQGIEVLFPTEEFLKNQKVDPRK